MEKQYNPLRNWRGINSLYEAGKLLGMWWSEYLTLELHPEKLDLKSDDIIRISQVTNIPLPVLVDWLTETTKEVV